MTCKRRISNFSLVGAGCSLSAHYMTFHELIARKAARGRKGEPLRSRIIHWQKCGEKRQRPQQQQQQRQRQQSHFRTSALSVALTADANGWKRGIEYLQP